MRQQKKLLYTVLGLGITGASCIKYLLQQGHDIIAMDSRSRPPELATIKALQHLPNLHAVHLGAFDLSAIHQADCVVVSPGLSLTGDLGVCYQQTKDTKIWLNDIELFARHYGGDILAVTGTNGKSTTCAMIYHILKQLGRHVAIGGNFGIPALDLMAGDFATVVLEVSSYQLELCDTFAPKVATILNLAPDHLDRYGTMEPYIAAKRRIWQHAHNIVANADDAATQPSSGHSQVAEFTMQAPAADQFGLRYDHAQQLSLAHGDTILTSVAQLPIQGTHNYANALAAIAVCAQYGIDPAQAAAALTNFVGLAHRVEIVAQHDGITWVNDSKATNVAAALGSIRGMAQNYAGKIIWLAGGDGKDADFTDLQQIEGDLRHTILFGRDKYKIQAVLQRQQQTTITQDLAEAITFARQIAQNGDLVLLAPACASWDQFKNFMERGERFRDLVVQGHG